MPRSTSAECLLAHAAAAAPPPGPPLPQAPRRQGLTLRLRGYRLGLRVPSEMWGATALALRLAQPPAGAAAHLQRSASVIAQVGWALSKEPCRPQHGPLCHLRLLSPVFCTECSISMDHTRIPLCTLPRCAGLLVRAGGASPHRPCV